MHRLLALFSIMAFPLLGQASEFSVILHGIQRPVTMSFPADFRLASSDEEYRQREAVLEGFRQNSGIKGHYNEILLRDWSVVTNVPSIVVGSLAATDGFQGKVSIKNWQAIRQVAAATNKKRIEEWQKDDISRQNASSGGLVKIEHELSWLEEQNDPDSIVMFSQTRVTANGRVLVLFNGRKTIYFDGYVIFANVAVDASKPDSLKMLKDFLNSIGIKSI